MNENKFNNIKRITIEESKNYALYKGNNGPIQYYLLIPSEDGWDDVIYFTNKLRGDAVVSVQDS